MNMIQIKKAVAGVSSALILLGSVVTGPMAAVAATDFTDVPASHWGYSFVMDAVNSGFFDGATTANPYFYPDRTLNRAELSKLVVKVAQKAGVLGSTLDTSGAPSFTDVPSSAWYYVYVSAAAKANLLSGYKDAAGNSTGKYGPSDLVTRAQAAKAFVNAAGVPNKTSPSATSFFTDVVSGQWYVEYVSTAYNWTIVDGYKDAAGNMTGRFGPNDTVTRAQTAKIISNAFNRKDRTATNGNTNGVTNTNTNGVTNTNVNTSVPKAGTLDVSLSSTTPAGQIIPRNTTAAPYLKVKVTAGATNDITLNSLTVTRVGLGDRTDFSKVWTEVDGVRVTSRQSIGTDERAVMVFSPAYVVKAGTSAELTVVAQMDATTGGKYNALSVQKSADVDSTAQNVTGNFPLIGNTMQTANYLVTEVAYYPLGSPTSYRVGETNRELAQFKLENKSDSKDVIFKQVTFKNNGSAPFSDFSNMALYVGSTAVAPSASVKVNGDYVTFNLGTGRTIRYGQSETYSVRGDIVAVDNTTGDSVELSVKYVEDLLAYESTTGFGVAPDPNNRWTAATPVLYTITGGTFILSKASTNPPTQTVSPLTTDVTFLVGSAKVGQAFTSDGIKVNLYFNGANSNSSSGEINELAAALDNVRVLWNNQAIGSTSLQAGDLTAVGGAGAYVSTAANQYTFIIDSTVTFNTSGELKVVGNLTNNAVENETFKMELVSGDGSQTTGTTADDNAMFTGQAPEYVANSNKVPNAELIGTASGNTTTVGRATLTLTRVDGLTNKNVVEGVQNYQIMKFRMQAGDTSEVRVSQLRLVNNGNANLSLFTTARLYDASNLTNPLQEVNFVSGTADFNSVNVTVGANQSKDFIVSIDTIQGIAPNAFHGGITYVDAKDPNSNNARVNGGNAGTLATPVQTATFAFITSGTLTVQADTGKPIQNVLVANTTGVPVGKWQLQAQKDKVEVTDLYFYNAGDGTGTAAAPQSFNGRVNRFTMKWTGGPEAGVTGQIMAVGSTAEAVVRFNMAAGQLVVNPDDSSPKVVTVYADLNPITTDDVSGVPLMLVAGADEATAVGGIFRPGTYNGVRALTNATGSELVDDGSPTTPLIVSGSTNQFVIRKSRPTFAKLGADTGTLVPSTDMELYRFSITAAQAGNVDVGALAFSISTSSGSVTVKDLRLVDESDGDTVSSTDATSYSGTTAAQVELSMIEGNPDRGLEVTAGSTRTFTLRGNVTDGTPSGTASISTKLVNPDTGVTTGTYGTVNPGNVVVWSDEFKSPHSLATSEDFTNGYLLNELNNIKTTTYTQGH